MNPGFILSILFLFGFFGVNAQHFEWAASASNIDLRYEYSSVDPQNNIVVGGPASRNSLHRGDTEIYNGHGEKVDLKERLWDSEVVLSFSSEGDFNWSATWQSRFAPLLGIAHDNEGHTVLLCRVIPRHHDENEKVMGAHPLISNDFIEAGYYLIFLDSKGNYSKAHKTFQNWDEYHLDFSSFQSYPGGGFVVTGFANDGRLIEELEVEAGPAGGDFVLLLDQKGTPLWADVVSYQKETCCSYYSDMCRAAVAPDGTVYLGGTFKLGGLFGGKEKIVSDSVPDQDHYNKPFETYVASYDPTGNLNWVKTSQNRAHFHSITAGESGVFVGFNSYKTNEVFGEKVDTTDFKKMTVAHFSKAGKLNWMETTGTKRSHDMTLDSEENLYVLGTMDKYQNTGAVLKDTLDVDQKIFIASFTVDGDLRWARGADIPIETRNNSFELLVDGCNNLFLTGTLWFVLPGKMSWWDDAFVKGEAYGAAPMISRFKNTKPAIERMDNEEEAEVEHSCLISPGPWKIKVFPNPLRNDATIEFELSYADRATLEIRDMNGKIVEVIYSDRALDKGVHTQQFTNSLAAGQYLITIRGRGTLATCRASVVN